MSGMNKYLKCSCPSAVTMADFSFGGSRVHAVLQRDTPSGSHKDHAGRFLVGDHRRKGIIRSNRLSRFVVPSSGNFGHSFATHTRDDRVEVVIVTDVLSPKRLRERFKTDYDHVRVEVVDKPDETGSHMLERLRLIEQLQHDDSRLQLVDQYANQQIPRAYELLLLSQLYRQFHEQIDGVFVAVGTGGLANALFHFRKRYGLNFPIYAVDADGSCLARPPRHGARRRLSGYGNGIHPQLMSEVRDDLDHWINVDDEEAVAMCHHLRDHHSLLVGPSSGAVLAAFEKMSRLRRAALPKTGNLIAILPDGGEAYTDTVFDARWLKTNQLLLK